MTTKISKKKVKMWMVLRGIDRVEDLAAKADMSPTTVYTSWDSNRYRGETLDKLAGALGVHPFDLLDAEGYPSPHVGAPASVGA